MGSNLSDMAGLSTIISVIKENNINSIVKTNPFEQRDIALK